MPEKPTKPSKPSVIINPFLINWKNVLVPLLIGTTLIGTGIAGYYYLGLKSIVPALPIAFPKIATPSAQKAETTDWQIYRNETFEFQLKYPPDLKSASTGPNSAQQQLDKGETASGTIQPSYDTIIFSNRSGEMQFKLEVFHTTEKSISPSSYDEEFYLSGACDVRRLNSKPKIVRTIKMNNNEFLEVKAAETKKFLGCYYFKNHDKNLIVLSSTEFETQSQFEEVNSILQTLLPTITLINN